MNHKSILLALAAAMAVMLTGCVSTFKEVKPLGGGQPPKERPTLLTLGDIKITDAHCSKPEQQVMLHAFQLGVEKWCAEHKALEVRRDVSATNAPPSAVV